MSPQLRLVLTFFFGGLLLIGVAFLIGNNFDVHSGSAPSLAKAEKISPPVTIFRKHLTEKEQLDKKTSLKALESLETGADGEAQLEFPSAYRLRILPNTHVTLDQEGEKTVLYLKTGSLRVENFGRDGSLFISQNGVRWSATEYGLGGKEKREDNFGMPAEVSGSTDESLSPSYILETLKAHKSIFYKCYTQLLQKHPGRSGEASVSVTIEPTGKISRSEVISSQFDDPGFKKCIGEALARLDFKAFAGEPITTVFPLQFE